MKFHLRNTQLRARDFVQAPHIFNALTTGNYAACDAGCIPDSHITDDGTEVTCIPCLRIVANQFKTLCEELEEAAKLAADHLAVDEDQHPFCSCCDMELDPAKGHGHSSRCCASAILDLTNFLPRRI